MAIKIDNEGKEGMCHPSRMADDALPIIAARSAAMWGDKCVWATVEGLVMALGTDYAIVSRPWFDKKAWIAINPDSMIGVVYKGHYFGATDSITFRMTLPKSIEAENK